MRRSTSQANEPPAMDWLACAAAPLSPSAERASSTEKPQISESALSALGLRQRSNKRAESSAASSHGDVHSALGIGRKVLTQAVSKKRAARAASSSSDALSALGLEGQAVPHKADSVEEDEEWRPGERLYCECGWSLPESVGAGLGPPKAFQGC